MKKSDDPIIIEETFKVSIESVWKSLTEIDLMRQWYFNNIPSFKPEIGFETQFNIKNEGRNFFHRWKVTDVIPFKKIAYEWTFDEYPGKSSTDFELFEKGNSTLLRLTVLIHEDFPDDIPEFKRESCIGGWEYFLKGRLMEFHGDK